ncbi:MAG: CRISPR-associated helicase/endonuclease Cas3 [Gammaproteobacteria bacterium]|nr:CRISPR-associated helicase/endonuclease Cas3 [Gammaproteobacteria bacterium]
MTETATYFRYWGKAKRDLEHDGPDYHLLPYHCLDVAAVAESWWLQSTAIRNAFIRLTGLTENRAKAWALFFIALHDYGKWDLRFQRKAPNVWNKVNPKLAAMDLPLSGNDIKAYFHGPEGVGWFYMDCSERFASLDWFHDNENWEQWRGWLTAVAGHHGHIPEYQANDAVLPSRCKAVEPLLKEARLAWLEALEALFLYPAGLTLSDNPPALDDKSQIMLAGFCSVCDWLGSSHFFPYDPKPQTSQQALKGWYEQRFEFAEKALTAAGVLSHIRPEPSVEKLLDENFKPRQVQCLLDKLPLKQNLTLIEASTGSGKTEVALAYAWQLLEQGLADSIVFALPTQATANAMFSRLEKAADSIFHQETNLVLAHGRAKYQAAFINLKQAAKPQTLQGIEEAWVQCGEWLAQSRKRVFLGQIGVCTVDQVLVSVLPIRHKFVRGFGIGRSVLIVDEVHAYDSYMYGLLSGVLQQQKAIGGSVILLSATLPSHQKQALANAWQCRIEKESDDRYPLITSCYQSTAQTFDLEHLPDQQPTPHDVRLELLANESLLPDEGLLQRIENAVSNGAQVCLVCNLVDVAQKLYQTLSQCFDANPEINKEQISLFHSRFTFTDRQQKEQWVLDTFGFQPKPENAREKGHLLIATQVVEQSLDVDFDWLITQLCPVDLLFQRMGRLHRHARQRPAGFKLRLCTILIPDSLDYQLHELIYGNSRVLWRTHQLLEEAMGQGAKVEFPKAYREWIEPVYQEEEWLNEPEAVKDSFAKFSDKAFASRCNANQLMTSSMNPLNDDDAKVSVLTRDGEMSLSLVPYVTPANGNRCLMNGQDIEALAEGERLEFINLNTVPVPHSWGQKAGYLPEPDINGLIWLEMQVSDRGYCCDYGIWRYYYSSENGFQRMENNLKET